MTDRREYFRNYQRERYNKNKKYLLKKNAMLLLLGKKTREICLMNGMPLKKIAEINALSQELNKEEKKYAKKKGN